MSKKSFVRIAVVGGGKMGEAIMGGLIASTTEPAQALGPDNFIVVNPGEKRRRYLHDRYGVVCVAHVREIESCDVVLLAVKPQVMMGVLGDIAVSLMRKQKKSPLFISIAAGLALKRLEGAMLPGVAFVRVMPNTPLLVGAGACAVCGGSCASVADISYVRDLFACLGSAYIVDEDDMDAVCAVSGSGPAYVAAMIEAMRDAGVKQGLDAQLAQALALQTVYGTAELIRKTGQSPAEARLAVCSPGGTTLAALDAMYEAGFSQVFDCGIAAAVRRAKELSSC